MTAIFMLRLPIEALPKETVKAMIVPYMFDIKATKTHWIITWSLEESEKNFDVLTHTFGGWQRDKSADKTVRTIKDAMRKSQERYNRSME